MDQAVTHLSTGPQLTTLDALAFFVIAVVVTAVGRYTAQTLFPGSHPQVRRAVVQAALLAGLALGAYVGLHLVDSGKSRDAVQMSAHQPQ
jgi:H+/Cl- antiporter ClcA